MTCPSPVTQLHRFSEKERSSALRSITSVLDWWNAALRNRHRESAKLFALLNRLHAPVVLAADASTAAPAEIAAIRLRFSSLVPAARQACQRVVKALVQPAGAV